MNITPVLSAFTVLRDRGIPTPVYSRLVLREKKVVGFLMRDPANASSDLRTGEKFILALRDSSNVTITWQPMFSAKFEGDSRAIHYAVWFFSQNPVVAGGTHQSIDNFRFGAADWNLVADDCFPVRCGTYIAPGGVTRFREPTLDAIAWIKDPNRFLTSENIRECILRMVLSRLPSGERLTIRRLFSADSVEP